MVNGPEIDFLTFRSGVYMGVSECANYAVLNE